jgi:hypothetical protein
MKILAGEVHAGDDVSVDVDAKTSEMKFTRKAAKAGAA